MWNIQHWLQERRAQKQIKPSFTKHQAQEEIRGAILEQKPFFAGRLGLIEGVVLGHLLDRHQVDITLLTRLEREAAIFPALQESLPLFQETYLKALEQLDLLELLEEEAPYHGWLFKHYASKLKYLPARGLDPFFIDTPWSEALAGKKVLVIHPFAKSILRQYALVREKLFLNKATLPSFELKVIQAPSFVSLLNMPESRKYESWHATLMSLVENAQKQEFDVALIGATGYGFPLAASLKKLGKVALQLEEGTQLLFGIKEEGEKKISSAGKKDFYYQKMINQHWALPLRSERLAE